MAVIRAPCPEDLRNLVVRSRAFTADVETRPTSLEEEKDSLRQRLDSTFQSKIKVLDQPWLVKRAAAA